MYAYKIESSESKKCKGIKKCVVKKTISFEDYKTCLFGGEATIHCSVNIILIMQTFSSDHTPCPPTAEEALFILYSLSSYCTTSSRITLCHPPGTARLLM